MSLRRKRLAEVVWLGLLLLLAPLAQAVDFPALTGRVVDEANLLSAEARAQLTEQLAQHEQATTNQVVVATVNSLQDLTIEDYGYQLGRFWGIGQKDKNNGVVLLVAPNERQVRIEVGYGLEGTLTDVQSYAIIQGVILPRFRSGEFEGGISDGVAAILGTLAGTYTLPEPEYDPSMVDGETLGTALTIGFFYAFFGLFVTQWLRSAFFGGLINGALTFLTIWLTLDAWGAALAVGFIVMAISLTVGNNPLDGMRRGRSGSGRGSSYSSSSWSSSSSSSGFSGGGGSFGGGGSSGSW